MRSRIIFVVIVVFSLFTSSSFASFEKNAIQEAIEPDKEFQSENSFLKSIPSLPRFAGAGITGMGKFFNTFSHEIANRPKPSTEGRFPSESGILLLFGLSSIGVGLATKRIVRKR